MEGGKTVLGYQKGGDRKVFLSNGGSKSLVKLKV